MPERKKFSVSVREFVEFSLRSGDLNAGKMRPGRPQEGTRVHQEIQNSRPENYRREVVISYTYETETLILDVNGRIDGIFVSGDDVVVEEIKTTYLDPEMLGVKEDSAHWGQLKTYAWFCTQLHNLTDIGLQLTYYHVPTQSIKEFKCKQTAGLLESFVAGIADSFVQWLERRRQWNVTRDISINCLTFPFATQRTGQSDISKMVFEANETGDQTMIQAATGVGKTIACLFPAVKSIGEGKCSKVFFLTSKTTGRLAAENAVELMRNRGLRLKSLSITAKEKICFNPDRSCTPEECVYAKGYYDRVNDALDEAFDYESFTQETISVICQRHFLCPFEFTIELTNYVDCIICDYNYAFDPRVFLRHFFSNGRSDFILLVDEAHNLVDRAREMYSAQLDKSRISSGSRMLSVTNKKTVVTALKKLNRFLSSKKKEMLNQVHVEIALDKELKTLVRQCLFAIQQHVVEQTGDSVEELLELFFELSHLNGTIERYGSNYVTIYEQVGRDLRLKLFCLHPGNEIQEKVKHCRSVHYVSGTLSPPGYFKDVLGCKDNMIETQLPSPFPAENLKVLISADISTRYKNRIQTKGRLCRMLQVFARVNDGNTIFFFPSYSYMNMVYELFYPGHPGSSIMIQERGLDEYEKTRFLNRFVETKDENLVAFAVMGGIFAEGIDLSGEKLTGVAIVGVGHPGLSIERQLLRDHYNRFDHNGYAYAYIYPGINRVLQAAGRLIRSETDMGAILLIDDRYADPSYQSLLPETWQSSYVQGETDLQHELEQFWQNGYEVARTKEYQMVEIEQ